MQAEGLRRRLEHIGCPTAVLGISGGLDSTLALLVAVRAMDLLGRPRTDMVAVTMPGFGTTSRTRSMPRFFVKSWGSPCAPFPLQQRYGSILEDIGHDECDRCDLRKRPGPGTHPGAYGYRQPAKRHRSRHRRSLRVGPGLGHLQWRPYVHVRRQYGSIPQKPWCAIWCAMLPKPAAMKPLPPFSMIFWIRRSAPELLPLPMKAEESHKKTEDLVGPYELHDFFLYHFHSLWLSHRRKLLYLAENWPLPARYDRAVILSGCAPSSAGSSSSSLSAAACRMAPRSARSPFPLAGIGECPVMLPLPCGCGDR